MRNIRTEFSSVLRTVFPLHPCARFFPLHQVRCKLTNALIVMNRDTVSDVDSASPSAFA
ncbi:hypothetical protein HMPREF0972_00484 [Actinomyces sp. oral taxon 848 str. F0332]|nr:hypothetical protein HMPREF0972_00484 [Actinomyces sp. oral taxon 848 str. F0332]